MAPFLFDQQRNCMSKDYARLALESHKKYQGKISVESKFPLETKDDLSIAYTPGVAKPCEEIAEDKEKAYDYTAKGNLIAVVSDGSAVLGLGNIGPEAGYTEMGELFCAASAGY